MSKPMDVINKHERWLNDEPGGEVADLRGVNLWGANLKGANLSEANLSSANLSEANLRSAKLRRAKLWGANLSHASLLGADLTGANLLGAILTGANLWDAILTGANLSGANLWDANLKGADLTGAILKGANLWEADLTGAILTGANLKGADLSGADLRDTILDPAITERNRRAALQTNQRGIVTYRSKTSRYVGNAVYRVGNTYTANAMSWCPNTECHPGLYAYQFKGDVPRDGEVIKVYFPAGEWMVTSKGAIRGNRFRVLEEVAT